MQTVGAQTAPPLFAVEKTTNITCPRPELLQMATRTDSSAQLTWTDAGNTYEMELRESGQAFTGVATFPNIDAPPFTVVGLQPGQNYRFQVRAICDDTTRSPWSNARSFATDLNNARPCPLNFDLRDTSCASGKQIFRVYVDNAPGLFLGGEVQVRSVRLMIEHPWRSDLTVWLTSPDNTRVQLISGLNAGDKNIGDLEGSPCAQFVELTDQPGALPLSAAAERDNITGYYLPVESLSAFENGQNPNGIWQLEICDSKANDKGKLRLFQVVFARTDCAPVDSVTVTDVTAISATLQWGADSTGDSLLIEYGPAGFVPGFGGQAGTGSIALNLPQPAFTALTLNDLTTRQNYEVYLRRQCAPGVWSPNSTVQQFFTNCTATLVENVDSLAICPISCAESCSLPGLWDNVSGDDYDWKVRTGPGLTFPVAGPSGAPEGAGNYLYFRNSCTPSGANGKKAILRTHCMAVSAPANQPCHFSFDLYMNTKTGQMGSISLQASTDGGQTWTNLQTWSGNRGKRWRREYVPLAAYDGQVARFQLVATGVFGAYGDIAIDNLTFYGSALTGLPDFEFFRDADGDGFGNPLQRLVSCNATVPTGYVPNQNDCNDNSNTIYPGAPEVRCNGIDENCNGMTDDTAIAAPSGAAAAICQGQKGIFVALGTPAGQFFWFDHPESPVPLLSGNTLTVNNLTQNRTFYLQDSILVMNGGCASVRTPVTIEVHPVPVLFLQAAPALCTGASLDLGALTIIDSATTNSNISWHSAAPANAVNRLDTTRVQPGISTIYIAQSTSAFGCSSELAVPVTVHALPSILITQGDSLALCRGSSVVLNAVGTGTSPLTYTWNNGLNFPNIPVQADTLSGLTTIYTATVIDTNGCTAARAIKIHTRGGIAKAAVLAIHNPTICAGTDGNVVLHALDGLAPYIVQWAGPTSGSNTAPGDTLLFSGLQPGGYQVTITDATGTCPLSLPQIILNAPGLTVQVDTLIQPRCPGDATGRIVLQVNGTNPTFQWSNAQTSATAVNLSTGVYAVTINDGNCTQTLANLYITPPPSLQIIQNQLTQITCAGQNTGAIDLAVFGATPPYQYLWSNNMTTADLLDIPAGDYQLTLTDANNCEFASPPYFIMEPPVLRAELLLATENACFGDKNGWLKIRGAGGVAPYQILWENGSTQSQRTSLAAGLYAATITDAAGCTAFFSHNITQPAPIALDKLLTTDPTCVGKADGRVEILVTGGTLPYHYAWNTGVTGPGVAALENQTAGIFSVTITDAAACTFVANSVALQAPQLLTLMVDSLVPVLCHGEMTGAIVTQVTGGQGLLTVTWNGASGSLARYNIAAGTYNLYVSDQRGCALNDTFRIDQPAQVFDIQAIELQHIRCMGEPTGSIDIQTSGGTLPYQYEWNNGTKTEDLSVAVAGEYELLAIDGHGCVSFLPSIILTEPDGLSATATVRNVPCIGPATGQIDLAIQGGTAPYGYLWSRGDTTELLYLAPAGNYTVTVLDAAGCAAIIPDLTVLNASASVSLSIATVQAVSCFGASDGRIVAQINGGMSPFQYIWSPPIGLHANVLTSTDLATGLSGGNYAVTVTDAAGCTAVSENTYLEEAPNLYVDVTVIQSIICRGDSTGAIGTMASGGLSPYQFNWNNGASGQNILDLPAGFYTVTVTDQRACTAQYTDIYVGQPTFLLMAVLDTIRPDACGEGTGALITHVTGGIPPVSIVWSNQSNNPVISNLSAGDYQLTLTDAIGCVQVSPVYTIIEPDELSASWQADSLANGWAVTLQIFGGTAPYNIAWNAAAGNQTGPIALGLLPGHYTATVTDVYNCSFVVDNIAVGTVGTAHPAQVISSRIMPNPTTGHATVDLELPAPAALTIRIVSITGQVMGPQINTERQQVHHILLDLESLPTGVYICEIKMENNLTETVRLVKM